MSTVAKQALILTVGIIVALIMGVLGLWQMQVFVDKGDRTVENRAAQDPVPLVDHVRPDGSTTDIYGKRVTVTGTYVPGQQLLLPVEGGAVRVLSALEIADGRVVPVVRGVARSASEAPGVPGGEQTQTGLFLPGEGNVDAADGPGELASVRMPLLAQRWTQPLTPGFITLDAPDAAAHGLTQAAVDLPRGEGSFQNGGYALQWWIFAAFGLGMTIKLAQSLGRRDRQAREDAARAELT